MFPKHLYIILNPLHRKKMFQKGIYIDKFQGHHDRHIFLTARKMLRPAEFSKVFVNARGITTVVKNGSKFVLKNLEDLQAITELPISDFFPTGRRPNDSGISGDLMKL